MTRFDLYAHVHKALRALFLEALEPPRPDLVAGGLSVEIANRLVGRSDVDSDDVEELAVGLAGHEELHDRDPQSLLVHLGRLP